MASILDALLSAQLPVSAAHVRLLMDDRNGRRDGDTPTDSEPAGPAVTDGGPPERMGTRGHNQLQQPQKQQRMEGS